MWYIIEDLAYIEECVPRLELQTCKFAKQLMGERVQTLLHRLRILTMMVVPWYANYDGNNSGPFKQPDTILPFVLRIEDHEASGFHALYTM